MSFLRGYARRLGVSEYLGTWNASTNTPSLTSSVGQRGGYYVVSVAGSTNLNGITSWGIGDWVIFNGSVWEKIDNSESVSSVAGKTGVITLDHGTDLSGLADDDHMQYLLADGTRAMAGDLNLNDHQIKNVEDPTSAQDAATKNYVDLAIEDLASGQIDLTGYVKRDGTSLMTGNLNLNSNKIINLANPTSDQDASTKFYVDSKIADILGAPASIIETLTGLQNALTDGDPATGILNAIDAERTQRINADAAIQSELNTTQTGAGLNTNGTYTAPVVSNYLSLASSLKDADSKLDTQIAAVQSELDTTQTGSGLNANGTYTAPVVSNYLSLATSLKDADSKLDTQIAAVQSELDTTQTGAGLNTNGTYTAPVVSNYLSLASSLKDADSKLDTQIAAVQSELDTTQTGSGLNTNGTYTAPVVSNYLSAATSLKDADSKLDTALKSEETARVNEDLTFLKLNGTRPMTAALNMDTNRIRNITQAISTSRTLVSVLNTDLQLLSTDKSVVYITGTASGYALKLPESTAVDIGTYFEVYNRNNVAVQIKYFDGSPLFSINPNSVAKIILNENGTSNGTWSVWSLETGVASGINNFTVSSTTPFATTSTTNTIITGFTVTPIAGTYLVWFNSSNSSVSNNALNYVTIYKEGVAVAGTERVTQSVASNFVFQTSTQGIVQVNGAEQIQVYVRVTTGTYTVNNRSLVAIRLGG